MNNIEQAISIYREIYPKVEFKIVDCFDKRKGQYTVARYGDFEAAFYNGDIKNTLKEYVFAIHDLVAALVDSTDLVSKHKIDYRQGVVVRV